MSKPFLTIVIALLVAGLGFEISVNYWLRAVNDRALAACTKPDVPAKHIQAQFWFPAGSWHE